MANSASLTDTMDYRYRRFENFSNNPTCLPMCEECKKKLWVLRSQLHTTRLAIFHANLASEAWPITHYELPHEMRNTINPGDWNRLTWQRRYEQFVACPKFAKRLRKLLAANPVQGDDE